VLHVVECCIIITALRVVPWLTAGLVGLATARDIIPLRGHEAERRGATASHRINSFDRYTLHVRHTPYALWEHIAFT
jgi:hypothetical protein